MFEYLDNGQVKIELIGRTATLRRPNLGEYRTLRSTLEAAQEAAADGAVEIRERFLGLSEDLVPTGRRGG